MKMTNIHYELLKTWCRVSLNRLNVTMKKLLGSYSKCKHCTDREVRARWDLYHYAGDIYFQAKGKRFPFDEYNDGHIDTALKRAVKELLNREKDHGKS